ncbi:phage holin family protein [Pantoea sp. SoEX]|uniref:phage holin family protein n=1 Tax=Pantoea sp. SoEX TaxID=2576763 RepID=UPI00135CA418|nr:phage holin family protein [Pantoea sp. SoEX]
MDTSKNKQKPSKNIINITQNIIAKVISIIETRLRLATLEIEEEKSKILKILLMITIMFMFIFLGMLCLLMIIVWSVNAKYRILTMIIISIILFLLSFLVGLYTFKKIRQSTLLQYTRKELKTDCNILEDKNE